MVILNKVDYIQSNTELQHEKAAKFLTYRKHFSSDTRQSMKRRTATERLSKINIARCGYTWLDESNWPKSGQLAQLPLLT